MLRHTLNAPNDGEKNTQFAAALAFSGPNHLHIGAPAAAHEGWRSGGANLFTRQTDGSWRRVRFIAPEAGSQEGKFSGSLAVDERSVRIGAPEDHADDTRGGAAWRLVLPQFENQRFAAELPDFKLGTAVARGGGAGWGDCRRRFTRVGFAGGDLWTSLNGRVQSFRCGSDGTWSTHQSIPLDPL